MAKKTPKPDILEQLAAPPGEVQAVAVIEKKKRAYWAWSTNESPQHAPTVCGIDFPKYVEPPVRDVKGLVEQPVMRAYAKGHQVMLDDDRVQRIIDALAAPIKRSGDKLLTGKIFSGTGEPMGPINRILFLSPIEEMSSSPIRSPHQQRRFQVLERIAELSEEVATSTDDAEKKALGSELTKKLDLLKRIERQINDEANPTTEDQTPSD